MSQKKMEAYKEAKKNKRQIEKRQKRNRILGWILGIIIAAALIGGSVYLVYYSSVILPKKQSTPEVTTEDATGEESNTDTTEGESNTDTTGEVLDGSAEDDMMVVPDNTGDTGNAEDSASTENDAGADAATPAENENTDATATDEAVTDEAATE